ncbi:MAG: 7-cyano-7-deazaguanine synthase QueC [endosymbiont of Galathealinum brachiosum]|uniref:7-cyano-7-deazaguanine synthase n=1 Tax=endosymbiont of Galathealinum brachiosum TaxID=2200906 RepID=A0A370DJ70_9GAMM|nr:MAG: 7-cyano-7-deazaguanine synthase QueC [endosymbiont of Galathealinum brachiosum]
MSKVKKKAVLLVSGGLDSATVLAMAKADGYECYALSFDYGQKHRAELEAAKKIAQLLGAEQQQTLHLDLNVFGGSALTDDDIDVPAAQQEGAEGIPVTYVPARNTIFLSMALAWAEVLQADDIFIGVNAVDYSGYPDCRPEFIQSYETMANLATKVGVEGHHLKIHTPLIDMTKAQIIQTGIKLQVDYSLTVSCYAANEQGKACGVCDSCQLRRKGFEDAGVADPTLYL